MRLCIICKKPIEAEREEVISDTRLCLIHGREIEKFGGEFRMSAEQETTSKKSSMKKNYGAVSTTRVRNDAAIEDLRDAYEAAQFEQ